MSDFSIAVTLVLRQEGDAFVSDPLDPGGATRWGISARAYPALNIATLTKDDAIAIYRRDYWAFDKVNDQHLANLLLSLAVNDGKATAIAMLQRAVGTIPDGRWGPMTEHLANATPGVLIEVAARAIQRYFGLVVANPKESKYLGGWIRRALGCLV